LGTLVLVGPPLLLYLVFAVLPILVAAWFSLTDWDGIRRTVGFVGLDNYARMAGDPEVHRAFLVTAVLAIVATLAVNLIAIPAAVLLSHNDAITRVYRSAIFFPLVLSPIVVGFLWQSVLSTTGLLNALLREFDMKPVPWLGQPTLAVASIAFVTIWQSLGFTTILYLAALRTIPDDLYEAARIDGAGPWAQFRHVTFPLLAPALTVNVVLLMIFFMRLYEYVLVMTQGGPVGSTQTAAYLLVIQAFERARYGYGSAIAIVMLLVVGAIALGLVAGLRRRERSVA
jgi:multiple sugar transport system permease protein/raffinose/stachyose/melibiose transport system permease protein